jgi:hypothetical protein
LTVTPELLIQVNQAANKNPTLASLLKLAASGDASVDQIRTLGVLIQQLAMHSTTPANLDANMTTDLILEYHERPGERFLIPREIILCELKPQLSSVGDKFDLHVKTMIKVPLPEPRTEQITLVLSSPGSRIVNFIELWADVSGAADSAQVLDVVVCLIQCYFSSGTIDFFSQKVYRYPIFRSGYQKDLCSPNSKQYVA